MLHFRNLGGLQKTRKTGRYRREKRQLHHFILREVLLELQRIRDDGGIKIKINGVVENIWPCLLCIITDEPEAQLCALMNSCRVCQCPNSEWDDINKGHELKSYVENEKQRQEFIETIKAGVSCCSRHKCGSSTSETCFCCFCFSVKAKRHC